MKFESRYKSLSGAPAPLPRDASVEVTLRGRVSDKGNVVFHITDVNGHPHQLALRWQHLYEGAANGSIVAVRVSRALPPEPGIGSLRMDRYGRFWINTGFTGGDSAYAWKRLGDEGTSRFFKSWATLHDENGPMTSIPEEIGGAR